MKPKFWIIFLIVLLLVSNIYWLHVLLDEGVSYTYLESSYETSEKMLEQTTRIANLKLIGLPADKAIQLIGEDVYGLTPFEKEGCIYAGNVCVQLDKNRIVVGIGKNDTELKRALSNLPSQDEKTAIKIAYQRTAVLVEKGNDIALVDFVDVIHDGMKEEITTLNDREVRLRTPQLRITYRYRYWDSQNNHEKSGKGELFEKYDRIQRDGETVVVDKGSRLLIKAGSMTIKWSTRDDQSGWLYFDPKEYRLSIISDANYEKQPLLKTGLRSNDARQSTQ